jgi:DNA mismatch repair protein MutS
MVLTGPNMAGKSTYLRQVALIVLMAQIGSFVPAREAHIGLVDRIFTRVGAQDDIAGGSSTFMVEMVETATILRHAGPRSLVVLDEIGRGTSTYDGLALARAVIEEIHTRVGARTLFATHFRELASLAAEHTHLRVYNAAVAEDGPNIVFLRKILPGAAARSYGIQVARLAGLPQTVTQRAAAILSELEGAPNATIGSVDTTPIDTAATEPCPDCERAHEVIDDILDLDPANMTPLEALNQLWELRARLWRSRRPAGQLAGPP